MKKLLCKEFKLSTSVLTPLFLVFSLMIFIPNYPLGVSAFFISFGIFHSFQKAREDGDILFTTLLPIPKKHVVTAKYLMAAVFQLTGFLFMTVFTVIRLFWMKDLPPYKAVSLLPANLTVLSLVLIVFSQFNVIFIGGFFKTAYKFGKPFVTFIIVSMLTISAFEVLPHLPGLAFLAGEAGGDLSLQGILLAVCAAGYALSFFLILKKAQSRFVRLDL